MLERAFGDVGDALDVAVGMHRPGGAGNEAVVVKDAKVPDPHVLLVRVLIEAEVPVGAEPAALGMVERRARTQDDGHAESALIRLRLRCVAAAAASASPWACSPRSAAPPCRS